MSAIQGYWEALKRLETNSSIRLPKGSKINNDNVALEAGRKRGSIKKSREGFVDLIHAIEQTAHSEKNKKLDVNTKYKNERSQKEYYRELYHGALNRELMLVERLTQLEKQLKHYGNITPIK